MSSKKLYIKTYGCQMNVYDSLRMADVMRPVGYNTCDSPQGADMVILNTCHIREKAAEKMYSELGRIRQEKEIQKTQGKQMIIAVAGCVGQAEGEEVFKRAPYVDVVVGPQSYQTLPDLIGKVQRDSGHAINLEFEEDKFDHLPGEDHTQGPTAFVSIQEGCDKFCTFCVVPYTRGAEYSRSVPEIYREVIKLVAHGSKEVTLLGQNVNAFHGKGAQSEVWNLGQLISHLASIEGLERIRYSTSHPKDMHESLYLAHASENKLMPFLNLPVQSGSNKILEAMNRKHTRETYIRIIKRLRESTPDMQFGTDLIVGFPGETDQDFDDTLELVKIVGYSQAYSFKYSPRPGTPGADMNNQVDEDVKDKRLQTLQKLIKEQQLAYNQSCIGKTLDVLFDGIGRHEQQLIGRSPFMQSVHVANAPADFMGNIAAVTIEDATANSLTGSIK